MTQVMMKTSGQKGFGKVGMRRGAKRNPFSLLAAPKPGTSEICNPEETEEVEAVEAASESRPDFNPPNEDKLRKLTREVVHGYHETAVIGEFFPIIESYARICNPGSQGAAVEHHVLVELRRHVQVIKAWPVRPNAQQIADELMRHGLNIPWLIMCRLESAVREPSKAVCLSSGEKVYQITIGSRRCYIKAERNGRIRLISLLTEKELKELRMKGVRSRKDTFRRHVPAFTR